MSTALLADRLIALIDRARDLMAQWSEALAASLSVPPTTQ
jgi:hypothetical protein